MATTLLGTAAYGFGAAASYPAYDTTPEPELPALVAPVLSPATGVTSSSATLSWSESVQAVAYRLRRNGTVVYEGPNRTFTDSSLSASTTYAYTVEAVGDGINYRDSDASVTRSVTTPAPPVGSTQLPAPAGLTVTQTEGTRAQTSWQAVANATAFDLQRATDAAFTRNVTVVYEGAATSYEDTSTTAGQRYYYRVLTVGNGTTYTNSMYSPAVATPLLNYAVQFAGSPNAQNAQYGLGPADRRLEVGSSWRLEMRYRPDAPTAQYLLKISHPGGELALVRGYQGTRFEVYAAGGGALAFRQFIGPDYTLGLFYTLAAEYDGTTLRLYLNGQPVYTGLPSPSSSYSYPVGSTAPALLIGTGDPNNGTDPGTYDYVKVFTNGSLLAYYEFDPNTGSAVPDVTGNLGAMNCNGTFIQL